MKIEYLLYGLVLLSPLTVWAGSKPMAAPTNAVDPAQFVNPLNPVHVKTLADLSRQLGEVSAQINALERDHDGDSPPDGLAELQAKRDDLSKKVADASKTIYCDTPPGSDFCN